ncbi:TPA: Holliday junction branch migration protein RuvA [Candidatus Wolfebacteria bacterium]|uniref:Holliday junction branch migration complex subunit RuvA n=2 Tax=Candidatus Wolfeibacteriota TaxID=1752735 RepID=A0A0G1U6E9_9BACT|nr:MAG: Holliday junction ATP-dependent DNA helicase RuvA, holliday junction DNA helicase RuvA [Candidatus Wolfebacteria bacterium GW2011_GWB1_47_1]KKU59112.1 MAG: Holliday junction ATP-dependent DNA helicase RuvA [Candidatus Wolfebacteria bacterium GW2011_GWE2_47_12]KKU65687.1 MAG: Holliday junction ATP-dependent DNA helicase RuvA [Candidatus Wolfebacteria bacterium GW2011_GWD2_47_17]KKU89716.1 MAG: Holliday junction ATP-dependent DNA helicase RuvA [Candidatus Wolfebacteria bacterium GW2011_GWA
MIYSVSGTIMAKKEGFVVIQAGGVGYKIAMASADAARLPAVGAITNLFCSFVLKKDAMELYGFLTERDLDMFDLVTTINGVGPKTAQGILGVVGTDTLLAAVEQKKVDVLAEFPGVGKKKAERIVLELRDKIKKMTGGENIEFHEGDGDIKAALKNLGYRQNEIDEAIKQISGETQGTEARLKAALKLIGKHK